MIWQVGQRLDSGYVIQKILGRGGFGITYLAKARNGELVAIKTVNDAIQATRDFQKCQKNFFQEIQRLQKCQHPNIVKLREVIQEDHLSGMVMDFIAGETLEDYVQKEKRLSEVEALRYIQQISQALDIIHQQDLLHRDVKPSNIMLTPDRSRAILIDFGIAREFVPNITLSQTQTASDIYAPPEQYLRRARRNAATDIYSLAATFYFLVTGQPPVSFHERSFGGEQLIPPKQLNNEISDRANEVILKGIEIKAEKRPQSISEWLNLLNEPQIPKTVQKKPIRTDTNIPWISLILVSLWSLTTYFFLGYNIVTYSNSFEIFVLVFLTTLLGILSLISDDKGSRFGRFYGLGLIYLMVRIPHLVFVFEFNNSNSRLMRAIFASLASIVILISVNFIFGVIIYAITSRLHKHILGIPRLLVSGYCLLGWSLGWILRTGYDQSILEFLFN